MRKTWGRCAFDVCPLMHSVGIMEQRSPLLHYRLANILLTHSIVFDVTIPVKSCSLFLANHYFAKMWYHWCSCSSQCILQQLVWSFVSGWSNKWLAYQLPISKLTMSIVLHIIGRHLPQCAFAECDSTLFRNTSSRAGFKPLLPSEMKRNGY